MSRNNPVHVNIAATGRVGAEPPPGAPHEIAQPLKADAGRIVITDPVTRQPTGEIVDPMERARQNERTLDPNPKFNTGGGAADGTVANPGGGVAHTAMGTPLAVGLGGVAHTASGSPHSTGGVAEATIAAQTGKLDPFYERHEASGGAAPVVDQSKVTAATLPPTSGSRILRRRPVATAPPPAATSDQVPVTAAPASAGPTDQSDSHVAAAAAGFNAPDADDISLTPEEIDAAAAAAELAEIQKTHPAASNSDSPSRGMPRRDPRAGLNVTGGWGDANAGSQYFALSGDDLRTIAQQMLLDLHDRLDNDLRFSIALVYPRVSVRATLHIHGYAGGPQSFEIERVRPADVAGPGGSPAPESVAAALADEVVFTLIAERREVDDAGDSIAAPDQLRNEFGIQRPGKHVVSGAGNSKRMADI